MPPITRWFLRTALVYFVAALVLGVILQLPAARRALPALAFAWPAYVHLFMLGWITQLILGVAFWMFPKAPGDTGKRADRTWPLLYATLNAGLLLRVVVEPTATALAAVAPSTSARPPLVGALLLLAATLQLAAGSLFVWAIWPRVRGR